MLEVPDALDVQSVNLRTKRRAKTMKFILCLNDLLSSFESCHEICIEKLIDQFSIVIM